MPSVKQIRAFVLPASLFCAAVLLGMAMLQTPHAHAAPASCDNSNVPRTIDNDTTLSGDLYAANHVYVAGEATLTLEPGTHLTMCGEYDVNVDRKSALHVEGTADSPITIESAAPDQQWGEIRLGWETDASVLRHVVLRNGGSSDATAGTGTVHITPLGESPDTDGPIVDHVTVENSGAYGIYVDSYRYDPTPPALTNLTVTGSARAPLIMKASDVAGLGTGNTLTGNAVDTVQVRGGSVVSDQTWRAQDVPYELLGHLSVKSDARPILTVDAGTHFRLHPDVDLSVGRPGTLVARGTATDPIVFDTADAEQKWGQLHFGWESSSSLLQHVVLKNGGGNDATADVGALHIDTLGESEGAGPVVDHVTVQGSGAFGVYLDSYRYDTTPPVLTNLTVEQSARAPILVQSHVVGGIGAGLSASDNNPDRIQVRGGRVVYSQRWRDHVIPYEILGHISLRSAYENPEINPVILTVDPGVTMRVHPQQGFSGGDLYGEGGFEFNGTAEDPITITRLDENSGPWSGFGFGAFNDTDSQFTHVNFSYGGGVNGERDAVFTKDGSSQVILENVSIQHSQNGAVNVLGGSVRLKDSTLSANRFGVRTYAPNVAIRGSDLSNNAEFAVQNYYPNNYCIDAAGNFWGAGGPQDSSDAEDACHSTRTHDGSGVVSDGVAYTPWRTGQDGGGDFGAIKPESFWVIANGEENTQITVQLKDAQGQPLADKEVVLETTVGTLQQPTAPTDANGETTAVISSTEPGFATITAMNETDGTPVAGTGGVNFWQGAGDFGGLVDPDGAPYASPAFEVVGKPFQQGFPVEMRMPMQNTRTGPVDVEVVYGVSGLGIGTRFTPVYTGTRTLQPGETWDARGVWVPGVTGHHCIQATLQWDDGAARTVAANGGGTRRINTDENPCAGLPSGPGDFSPDEPEGGSEDLKTVAKHFKDQGKNMWDATKCIDDQVSFRSAAQNGTRDYEEIVSPPTYTPPAVQPGANLTQAQADALNALAQSSSRALGLSRAIAVTRQRMQWAAQADALGDLDRQYQAYLDFVAQYAQTLRTWADQHDALLAVTEDAGIPDAYYYPEDYEAAYADLKQNGFDADSRTYLEESGLGAGLIEELRQDMIDRTEGESFQTTSFYQVVRASRDEARHIARQLERQYGLGESGSRVAAAGTIQAGPQPFEFTVGNPYDEEKTVDLSVRPVSLPMDWSARLAEPSVTLGMTETVTNTLTLIPGETVPEESTVQVSVEGRVDGELIGGILFTYNAPVVSRTRSAANEVYIPAILK